MARASLDAADLVAVKALRSSDGPVTVSFSSLGKYQLMASPGHDGTTNITGLPLDRFSTPCATWASPRSPSSRRRWC